MKGDGKGRLTQDQIAERVLARIVRALRRHTGKSVKVMARREWEGLCRPDGQPTLLEYVPIQIGGEESKAYWVTCSGIENPSPGFDKARWDCRDKHPINRDHHRVIEDLARAPGYKTVLKIAEVSDTKGIREGLWKSVFVLGNERPADHWVDQLPEPIKRAKRREE